MDSAPAMVARPLNTLALILSRMKRTEPSQNRKLQPPGWRLLYSLGPASLRLGVPIRGSGGIVRDLNRGSDESKRSQPGNGPVRARIMKLAGFPTFGLDQLHLVENQDSVRKPGPSLNGTPLNGTPIQVPSAT